MFLDGTLEALDYLHMVVAKFTTANGWEHDRVHF